ncbi:11749_t:CDS:2, partial [Gigaspora margarita]
SREEETKIMTKYPEDDQSNSDTTTPILLQKIRKKQVQASSTTIAKDTTEDITENTTENTMPKSQETLAQTKLKEELIQLNWKLLQLQNLEDK